MISAYSNQSSTSGSIISGVPSIAVYFERYAENFIPAYLEAVEQAAAEYTEKMREYAVDTAGWGEIGKAVQAGFDKEEMSISFDAPQEAEYLEYGRAEQAPRTVLRKFSMNAGHDLPALIQEKLQEKMT